MREIVSTVQYIKDSMPFNVEGPTTPLADQRSPASPGSVSMGLGTWPVTVALPEIKAVDTWVIHIENQYVIYYHIFILCIFPAYASMYENVPHSTFTSLGFLPEALLGGARP